MTAKGLGAADIAAMEQAALTAGTAFEQPCFLAVIAKHELIMQIGEMCGSDLGDAELLAVTFEENGIDAGAGELLAFASKVPDGYSIRLLPEAAAVFRYYPMLGKACGAPEGWICTFAAAVSAGEAQRKSEDIRWDLISRIM